MKSILCLLVLSFSTLAQAQILKWDLMHTRPATREAGGCNHPPHSPSWCDSDDRLEAAKRAGMEDVVRSLIAEAQDPTKSSIVIAYFSFSNRAAFEALCEAGKRGISIKGFFDSDYASDPSNFPGRLAAECQAPGKTNVDVRFLGAKNTMVEPIVWRLHHNKFLLVDSGNPDSVSLNFSSGNLSSSGLSLHFDHWGVLRVRRSSNIYRYHQCVVSALDAARPQGSQVDDPDRYLGELQDCVSRQDVRTSVESSIKSERVAALFAPNAKNEVYRALKSNIARVGAGGAIYGAIQHFLHYGIAQDLCDAADRGAEITLLMDNDVMSGESEVPGVRDFFESALRPCLRTPAAGGGGFTIRYMETNAAIMQMMHNKFIVLKNLDGTGRDRTFSGAGHFTSSAMRRNYENFYITESPEMVTKYTKLFEYMKEFSLSEEQVVEP